MTEKQSAILSAMKLSAHGLSDVQNVEEAKVYAGIIFSLNCELEKETSGTEANDRNVVCPPVVQRSNDDVTF